MIMCPNDFTVNTMTPSWTASATDVIDTMVEVTCNPESESSLSSENNEITCTATDDADNSAECMFSITVGRYFKYDFDCYYEVMSHAHNEYAELLLRILRKQEGNMKNYRGRWIQSH